jgi:menaquinone-dependent protoporphyrinogen IX oxidase
MKRGDAPSTERDREFTDWNALAGFVDGIIETAADNRV